MQQYWVWILMLMAHKVKARQVLAVDEGMCPFISPSSRFVSFLISGRMKTLILTEVSGFLIYR